jgi:hypothetical protein
LRTHAHDVSSDVETIVMKALAKNPSERFASMAEMASALSGIGRLKTVHGLATDSSTERSESPQSRRRSNSTTFSLVLAAIAFGLGTAAALVGARLAGSHSGGLIFVTSDPSGAGIEVDGKPADATTPRAITGLSPGRHFIRVKQQGRRSVEQAVTLNAGEQAAIQISLPASSHPVEVSTVPNGAYLFVDGHLIVGQTPLVVEISDDDFHELRVEKPGFAPTTHAWKPEDRQTALTISLPAETAPFGSLWVEADRSARVLIDHNDTGFVAPTAGIRLPVGEHSVELQDGEGIVGATRMVKVSQGDVVHVSLKWADPAVTK